MYSRRRTQTGMTKTPVHKPAGTPEGGQFAATSHAEPAVALEAVEPAVDDRFSSMISEEFAADIDASLKGRIKGKDWYSGGTVNQEFESEPDGDGGIYIYTRHPSADEGVAYTVKAVDGTARITRHDDHGPDTTPRDLHPESWTGPEDAVKEIADTILDMEGGATEAAADARQSPDGFASDAEYRRWRER